MAIKGATDTSDLEHINEKRLASPLLQLQVCRAEKRKVLYSISFSVSQQHIFLQFYLFPVLLVLQYLFFLFPNLPQPSSNLPASSYLHRHTLFSSYSYFPLPLQLLFHANISSIIFHLPPTLHLFLNTRNHTPLRCQITPPTLHLPLLLKVNFPRSHMRNTQKCILY